MNDANFPSAGLQQAIERLATMPAFLGAAIEAADPGELVFRPGEDGFSLTEQACHLRDLEREGYLVRKAIFGGERITLADLVAMVIDHDRSHREEIEELLDAMESP